MVIFLNFFQEGGRRYLKLLKFQIFNDRNGQEGRKVSLGQILSKALEPWQRYGVFWFFKIKAVAILDF